MSDKKIVLIGAGIAGIATAIRLAVKGYRVEVFEANSQAGGKLGELNLNGFRFDTGPSLLTMPQYIDELFALTGKNPADYFGYQKLDINCKYFYEDGTQLNAFADLNKFVTEITQKTEASAQQVQHAAENSQKIYEITNPVFLQKSLHRLKTYLSWRTIKSIFCLPEIDAMRTMHKANEKLFDDQRVAQFFDRYATYNGSNPYTAPATLNVIPHLEQHYGAYFPTGGMYSIITALVKLSESSGVKFHYNSPVDGIVLEHQKIKGVHVNGEFIVADLVISNMDIWFTYKKLLKSHPKLHPTKILQQERSSSAIVFYWGVSKQFSQLDLHNIFFSADYKAEFNQIWTEKTISDDPTVYLNVSSKYKSGDAPEGCENWFVMINVPANVGQNWDELIVIVRKNIIQKLSNQLGEDISKLIVCESILDPRSIESKTSSYQGSIYGTSSNSKFAAFLRHANRSSKIDNLYFCGGSVHPGGGIPLCLLSAKIVSDWVD